MCIIIMSYVAQYDEVTPVAVPVTQKYPLNYSIAMQIQRISVNASAIIYWVGRICKTANVFEILVCSIMILGTLYALVAPMFETIPLIDMYSARTLREAAMCSNIVQGFEEKKKKFNPIKAFQFHFKCPSISPDIKHAYNTFLMVFYEVCENIYNRLNSIDDRVASLQTSVSTLRNDVQVVSKKQDEFKESQEKMHKEFKESQEKIMQTINMILQQQRTTNTMLTRFSFVVEE